MALSLRLDRRRLISRLAIFFASAILLLLWLNPNWTDRSIHQVFRFDPAQVRLSDASEAPSLCHQHGWTPFSNPAKRKVYDLIMINTELDWLEIRLNTTYPYVDYFVIVESKKTFTNHDKPLVIKDNLAQFSEYRDKIIYHELEIPEGFHSDRSNRM